MIKQFLLVINILSISLASQGTRKNFFDFSAKDIDGKIVKMSDFVNKKCLLVVNVACKWLITHEQYTQLTALYNKYKKYGFHILAFPCN